MAKLSVRRWSATTRKATSMRSCSVSPVEPTAGRVDVYLWPHNGSMASNSGRNTSVS